MPLLNLLKIIRNSHGVDGPNRPDPNANEEASSTFDTN